MQQDTFENVIWKVSAIMFSIPIVSTHLPLVQHICVSELGQY